VGRGRVPPHPAGTEPGPLRLRSALTAILAGNGLQNQGITGLKPAANVLQTALQTFRLLRARKRGELTYLEAARGLGLRESRDKSILFMGWARKDAKRA
jgi:hypothetical protein